MEIEPRIYFVNEKEVHMVGDSVGVCWNLTEEKKQIKGEDGLTYVAKINIRSGKPYINFVSIVKTGKGNFYEDEDSSVVGGIEVEFAKKIVDELKLAIEYISTLK